MEAPAAFFGDRERERDQSRGRLTMNYLFSFSFVFPFSSNVFWNAFSLLPLLLVLLILPLLLPLILSLLPLFFLHRLLILLPLLLLSIFFSSSTFFSLQVNANAAHCLNEVIVTCRDQLFRQGCFLRSEISDDGEDYSDSLALALLDATER